MSIATRFHTGILARWFVLLLVGLLLAACAPSASEAPATPSLPPSPTVQPPSATARPTQTAIPTRANTATPTPLPTQTHTPTLPPNMIRVSAGRVVVPVLLYHRISNAPGGRYITNLDTFRSQMKVLYDEGYQTISISQLAQAVRQGGVLPEKAVVLTFDDGYLETYINAFPILQEFGFTGVTYVITSTLEKSKSHGYMQEAELKELLAAGWEIGSHSVTHTDLKKTKLGAGNEIRQSKETLEALLGVPVTSFCYPYGVADQTIKELVQESGYDSGAGLDILVTHTNDRLYYMSRREVYRSMTLAGFRKLLAPGKDEVAVNDALLQTPAAP